MKFREYKKALAIALMVAMVTGTVGTSSFTSHAADKNVTAINNLIQSETGTNTTDDTKNAKPTKDETVYAKIDESGSVKSVTVSDQLKNVTDIKSIEDVSNLKNIENVKGDEKFTKTNSAGLKWSGDGSDICYQGTASTSDLPVGVKITYKLDGKTISSEDLKGKSGHLTVRYEYQNTSQNTSGTFTPFLMATGIVVDSDTFSNVTVTNGKISSDGERDIVIGMGLPKIKDELGVSDLDLPDYFEMEADVKDYSAPQAITIATNEIFNELGIDRFDSIDQLKDSMSQLGSASKQLVSGSGQLKEGLDTLLNSSGTMVDGVNQLADGSNTLKAGTGALADGSSTLSNGLNSAATQVNHQLLPGVKTLDGGLSSVQEGAEKIGNGLGMLNASITEKQMADGAKQLSQGAADAAAYAKQISDGIAQTFATSQNGVKQLQAGTARINGGFTGDGTATNPGLNTVIESALAQAQTLQTKLEVASTSDDALEGAASAVSNSADNVAAQAAEVSNHAENAEESLNEASVAAQSLYSDTTNAQNAIDTLSDLINSGALDESAAAQINAAIGDIQAQQSADAAFNDQAANVESAVENAKVSVGATSTAAGNVSAASADMQSQVQALPGVQATTPAQDAVVLARTIAGAQTIAGGIQDGVKALEAGEGSMMTALTGTDAQTLQSGAAQLAAQIPVLAAGAGTLSDGVRDVAGAVSQLNNGVNQSASPSDLCLLDGVKTLKAGSATLVSGVGTLNSGLADAATGSAALNAGAMQLDTGAGTLNSGLLTLQGGTGTLVDGVQQLDTGAAKLNSGMIEFDETGIDKLVNAFDGDINGVLDKMNTMLDASKNYKNYSGIADNMEGSVKFVFVSEE